MLATSLRYTAPFSDLMIKFSRASGVSISPIILMVLRWPELTKLPAESVIFPFPMACKMSLKLTLEAIIL